LCSGNQRVLADAANTVSADYCVQAIPVNVVIDGSGIVRYVATGFYPAALKATVSSLLK
jgi:hypothetical protein